MPLTDIERKWVKKVSQVLSVSESEPEQPYEELRAPSPTDSGNTDHYGTLRAPSSLDSSGTKEKVSGYGELRTPSNLESSSMEAKEAGYEQMRAPSPLDSGSTEAKASGYEAMRAPSSTDSGGTDTTPSNYGTLRKLPTQDNEPTSKVKTNGMTTRALGKEYKGEEVEATWRETATHNEAGTAKWSTKYYDEQQRKQSEVDVDSEGVLRQESGMAYTTEHNFTFVNFSGQAISIAKAFFVNKKRSSS